MRWFFVVAAIMFAIAVAIAFENRSFETGGADATATIERVKTRVRSSSDDARLVFQLAIRFTTAGGDEISTSVEIGEAFFDSDPREGDTIEISYRTADPTAVRHREQGGYGVSIFLAIMGLIFFVVAAWIEWG